MSKKKNQIQNDNLPDETMSQEYYADMPFGSDRDCYAGSYYVPPIDNGYDLCDNSYYREGFCSDDYFDNLTDKRRFDVGSPNFSQKNGGFNENDYRQQPIQNQQNAVSQQATSQPVNAGYGYTTNQPLPNVSQPNGVQLSPIVIPVSFVPYTTQNQPLYQVETVLPVVEIVKHRGCALFMFVLSVAVFVLYIFPIVDIFTPYGILSTLLAGVPVDIGFLQPSNFETILFDYQGGTIVAVGGYLMALSLGVIFLVSIYNSFKYLIKIFTGKVKKGPTKSHLLLVFCVVFLFIGIVLINSVDGVSFTETLEKAFQNSDDLVYGLNFVFYALVGISILLFFSNIFIRTERYAPVEGALPEQDE